ncbi:MAG TPA: hypothetical protein VM238_01670 [Phycisphaerae bacterium]|nr:hypothetical protein [Phycisphaerae bacterium]
MDTVEVPGVDGGTFVGGGTAHEPVESVIAAAAADLLVFDRTGSEFAQWTRRHGGKLLDAARLLLSRAGQAESALAAEVVAHADAQAELARLRAIVGRLPLTADGVPIMPEMVLCCPHGHDCVEWDYEDDTACCLECDLQGDPGVSCVGPAEYKLSACFSTPAAAAAAKETRDGNGTTDQA